MASTKAIRNQIYDILNNMTAVSGTTKTTANHIPRKVADYEGYIFRIRMVTGTNKKPYREIRLETHNWIIELFSPPYDIGFYDEKENHMYDYRDAVFSEFDNNKTLEYESASLSGVTNALIGDDRFTWGDTEWGMRYKWQCTLSLENRVSCQE